MSAGRKMNVTRNNYVSIGLKLSDEAICSYDRQSDFSEEDGAQACQTVLTYMGNPFYGSIDAPADSVFPQLQVPVLREIIAENLQLKYAIVFPKVLADILLKELEDLVEYFSGDLLKVKVHGRWHKIPRKQVCYGDKGLSYRFSGNSFPAVPWMDCPMTVLNIKNIVEEICKRNFNFVLVNRYKNGREYMGEHRDDETDLEPSAPIVSVSFGQQRDFIFKHKDARGKNMKRSIPPVKLELEHGSLLVMEPPTNKFWYHSLPVRANADNVRVNLTFRQMKKNN